MRRMWLLLLLPACSAPEAANAPPVVASVTVTPASIQFTSLAGTRQLEAAARTAQGQPVTGKTATWRSSDTTIVSVTTAGLVSPVGNGNATVSATVDGVSGSADALVMQVPTSLEIHPGDTVLTSLQATVDVVTTVRDSAGQVVQQPAITWALTNDDVADLVPSGMVAHLTARRDGQVSVIVRAGALSSTSVFTVTDPTPGEPREWAAMSSPTSRTLYDVWGSSPADVWAVGGNGSLELGTILHYDGVQWTLVPTPANTRALFAVWGSGPNDVWAGGQRSLILHYDGTAWTQVPGAAFRVDDSYEAIWGTGLGDVWATGRFGLMAHFDGTNWANAAFSYSAMWGASSRDIWAVGLGGSFGHYDGAAWAIQQVTNNSYQLTGAWGAGPDDIWVTGTVFSHYDGATWSFTSSGDYFYAIWGSGPSDVWSVGPDAALIAHYDGQAWSKQANQYVFLRRLLGLWGTRAGELWAVGENGAIVQGVSRSVLASAASIEQLELAGTTLTIGGPAVDYQVTVNSSLTRSLAGVGIQAYVDQGATSRAANGTGVRCSTSVTMAAVLTPGSCTFGFTIVASNGAAGSGTLVPGSATARFVLERFDVGLDTLRLPITLQ